MCCYSFKIKKLIAVKPKASVELALSTASVVLMSRRDSKPVEQNDSDFRKYIRNFCMRFVQVIVSARMGIDLNQPCIPPSEADSNVWFNFKQEEFGEITAYLKSAIKKYPPDISVLTVDFFLHTASGDNLPLESWSVSIVEFVYLLFRVVRVVTSETDKNVNVSSQLYRQLGTLLMSVCAAARATPAGRHYTKKQGEKTFVHESEPELELLGSDHRSIIIGNYPSPFGSVIVEFNYRTKMELSLPPYVDEQAHPQFTDGDGGIFLLKASIPIKKPLEQRGRLVILTEQKPKAKNWFNPLADELPFIADMSRPRNPTLIQSVESEPVIPTIYQNLPPEVLATMPEELKSPQKPTFECGSAPLSEFSLPVSLRIRSILMLDFSSKSANRFRSRFYSKKVTTSKKNLKLNPIPPVFNFPATANSSSDSSGSKRYDSDVSTTSSIRDMIRQKQLKSDELFGFLEMDDINSSKPVDIHIDQVATSPLQAFTPPSVEIGPDLDEFVREMSLAPRSISSLEVDDGKFLNAQLEHFKRQAPALNEFISSIVHDS
ncbi:Autophagy-related protein 13-like protein [Aphelenchoides besseyi]|nr:Autophagy-related protein 13-like protein [Aphelenchoides besseyi]